MYPSLVLPLLVAPLRHSHQPIELAGRCCIGFINSAAVSRLVYSPHGSVEHGQFDGGTGDLRICNPSGKYGGDKNNRKARRGTL